MPRLKTFLAAACAAATSAGALESCWEVAPGSSSGRRRLVMPAWAAARLHPTEGAGPAPAALARLGPEFAAHFTEQVGALLTTSPHLHATCESVLPAAGCCHRSPPASRPLQPSDRHLPAPPTGHISMVVGWGSGALEGPAALPVEVRAAVDGSAAAAEAALAALAALPSGAFGRVVPLLQRGGVRVEPVLSPTFFCGASGRCVLLTTGAAAACCQRGADQADQAAAARATLLYLLGHELGHILAGHTVEKAGLYVQQMLAFSCRCMLADARRRLRCMLAPSGAGVAAAEAAWRAEVAALQLQVAAHLQWLSW